MSPILISSSYAYFRFLLLRVSDTSADTSEIGASPPESSSEVRTTAADKTALQIQAEQDNVLLLDYCDLHSTAALRIEGA
ncbi:hypothetical protein B1A99_07730 [Cohnella sp. CIP 111063]|jgi:hypothetical protein|nr:hypothetical protein B1A99_07730 [Cohnella sp. CIP 111063]PRX73006.1 hypothetical protein B0G52_10498 [Cohnella sp. SGD-V74]